MNAFRSATSPSEPGATSCGPDPSRAWLLSWSARGDRAAREERDPVDRPDYYRDSEEAFRQGDIVADVPPYLSEAPALCPSQCHSGQRPPLPLGLGGIQ